MRTSRNCDLENFLKTNSKRAIPGKVSLLVPCFNAAKFAPRFLGMVGHQTRPYDSTIFYDDGSTDGTAGLLRSMGCTVILGGVNRGAAYARNRLLEACATEFVHFHDIDDDLDPEFVRRLLPHASANRASVCAFQRRRPDGSIARLDRFEFIPRDKGRIAYFLDHFLSFNAAIYPRRALLKEGGFNETLRVAEDVNLLLRLAASGLEFHYEDAVLTTWQLRADSTYHSTDSSGGVARAMLECLRDLCSRWPASLRVELGPTALETAWNLFRQEDHRSALDAARLAQHCGAWTVGNRGGRIKILSRLVGPYLTYMWLLRRAEKRPGRRATVTKSPPHRAENTGKNCNQ